MKKFWKLFLGILGVAILIVLVTVTGNKHRDIKCNLLSIHIDYQNTDHLITALEVRELVYTKFDTLEGKLLKSIDLISLEKLIADIPVVEQVTVSSQISGDITIRIKQRKPIARFIDNQGNSYYLDDKGF